jgi:hypothetical protein
MKIIIKTLPEKNVKTMFFDEISTNQRRGRGS